MYLTKRNYNKMAIVFVYISAINWMIIFIPYSRIKWLLGSSSSSQSTFEKKKIQVNLKARIQIQIMGHILNGGLAQNI